MLGVHPLLEVYKACCLLQLSLGAVMQKPLAWLLGQASCRHCAGVTFLRRKPLVSSQRDLALSRGLDQPCVGYCAEPGGSHN